MIVLDTNVISELMRSRPEPNVLRFVDRYDRREVRTTAISVAEVRLGIALLPVGRRRSQLAESFDELLTTFLRNRVLPVDEHTGSPYARIGARRAERGRPITMADALIAAICIQHDAALASRNTSDFEMTGIRVLDPWTESA